ncbi:MAG TPA: DNA repair exonuclease [Coriobacteriia bacterium]|nr:DNA repair exonuclease [Coriobacteriia bacterium]
MTHTVRFVHAADVHLDAPFKGVDATDPRVKDALVSSTYAALDSLVGLCIEREVDFLVIAGDVYNAAERSLRAEFAVREACQRLADASIRVYLAHGNHDPASARTAGLEMPPEVHVFSATEVERVVFERDGEPVCALYGRSFRTAAETGNLALGFHRNPADPLAIGVLHANVGGRPGHEPYAPCSLDDLRAAGMDYWALGHIHKPEVLSERPAVVYAGCTQGLQPNESGMRGCRVVTLSADGAETEFVPTASVVWERADVSADDAEGVDDVRAALVAEVDRMSGETEERPVVARFALSGRSAAHADLAVPGALRDLLAEVRGEGLDRCPWVWVDRIKDHTRAAIDLDTLREGEDIAGDLVRLADGLASDDEVLAALVGDIAAPLLGALDRVDAPEVAAAAVLERARDLALDRLLAGEE